MVICTANGNLSFINFQAHYCVLLSNHTFSQTFSASFEIWYHLKNLSVSHLIDTPPLFSIFF